MTSTGQKFSEDDDAVASPGILASAKAAGRETRESLASVFRNRNLRRVQLSLVGSTIGDWAYATAVTVWAYGVGGATAVGIWAAIRLTLMAVTAPLGAAVADRMSRKKLMILCDLVRVGLVTAAAVCLYLDTTPAVIFVLATLTSLLGTPFRCAQRALMPSLAEKPDELTASNGTSSTVESLAFFVGPALGAMLLVVADVSTVFLLNAATFVWSTVMVLGIRVPTSRATSPAPDEADGAPADGGPGGTDDGATDNRATPDETAAEGFLAEVSAGFRSILADRDLFVVVALVCAQTVVAGASVVFTVVMAVEVLEVGPHGVGYLDSVLGVGAIVGGIVAIARSTKHRLAEDMTIGVVLWSLPLLLVTVWPSPVAAFSAVCILGLANPLVDVNLDTIVQRMTPDAVLGRVFGSLEACLIATMALGSFVMPFLLHWTGLRTSMAIIAVAVAGFAIPCLPRMRRLDVRLRAPAGLSLLRAIPMFAPLSPATVEGLAGNLSSLRVAAGNVVLREGEDSDRFFVIESGLVEVTQSGTVLRREGPGEFFGEIGLLRDVPRTATITALEDSVLLVLGRQDFLDAVTGQREARLAADDIVSRRLTV
ncbi:MAG TPA: MFS transporter [Nocardioidaceae bacterium]|nr:MFS transporter [Nocardioidaceae bacterium]